MRRFLNTVSTALNVSASSTEDGAALIILAIRGFALPADLARFSSACPDALELVDFERLRSRSDTLMGPPPQTIAGILEELAELGISGDGGRLFMCFVTGFVAESVGDEVWHRIIERAPHLVVGPEDDETAAVDDGEPRQRQPLTLPSGWKRGEFPQWSQV